MLNTIKYAVTVLALTALSSAVFAAQPVTPLQAERIIGATTMAGLETRMVNKLETAGAADYRIISAAGRTMAGSAIIYQ